MIFLFSVFFCFLMIAFCLGVVGLITFLDDKNFKPSTIGISLILYLSAFVQIIYSVILYLTQGVIGF